MKGRKPKPTNIHILNGNPSRKALPHAEPKPARGDWTPPDWLTGEALATWERIVPEMVRLGVFTAADRDTVTAYCAVFAEIAETVKKGDPLKSSLVGQLRSLAAELGCTPSSRTRLSSPKQADDDDAFFAVG